MSDDRLPTALWVQAGLAQCSGQGISAMVLHKGDPHTGVVLVKIATLDGACRLLTQQRDMEGKLRWVDALPKDPTPSETDADAYQQCSLSEGGGILADPDLDLVQARVGRGQHEV